MISGENLFSNLLTVGILLGLATIIYCKVANKTLLDLIRDIREGFSDTSQEVYDYVPNSFENIR